MSILCNEKLDVEISNYTDTVTYWKCRLHVKDKFKQ